MLIRGQVIDKEIRPPWSILTLLRGVFGHLSRRYRIQPGLSFVLILANNLVEMLSLALANNLVEMLSLAAVIPFIVVLSDPQRFPRTRRDVQNTVGIADHAATGQFLGSR